MSGKGKVGRGPGHTAAVSVWNYGVESLLNYWVAVRNLNQVTIPLTTTELCRFFL